MPREIVLGNQNLLVNIDRWLQVRDFFFPYVGEENHVQGNAHKIGIYVDNQFSWVSNDDWHREINYDKNTLVSHAVAKNERLQLEIHFHDCVAKDKNIFVKKVSIKNYSEYERSVKIFFYQDFHLYGNNVGDTACYDAHRNAICHYKRNRYVLVNAIKADTCASCQPNGDIYEYAVGQSEFRDSEGTWRDAEDGHLSKNPIAQGSVDSVVSLDFQMHKDQESVFYYWIATGENRDEVMGLNDFMMTHHPDKIFEQTRKEWEKVVTKEKVDFKDLGNEIQELYYRSILLTIAHTDKRGAITAANDSDNMKFNRDTYSYCWPRDGALVAIAMDKAGFYEYTKPFFEFCSRVISKHGAMFHKYNPDGSLGSTWHPWVKDGKPHLPIQEDETALVVHALWIHYQGSKDKKFAKEMYEKLVLPMAEFMSRHIYENGLPTESYDLWEEREGILTYTVASVIAGLNAAANFAKLFKDKEKQDKYNKLAKKMKKAMLEHLWDEESGMFYRMINYKDGNLEMKEVDKTPEVSTWGLFNFGVLEADDMHVISNMEKLKEHLWVKTDIGGMARYTNDYYHRISQEVPGNPWLICTMWLGQWYIAKAKKIEDLKQGKEIIDWIVNNSTHSGLLAEQLNPYSGEELSVSPLTWSHAVFVEIVQDYIKKYEELSK